MKKTVTSSTVVRVDMEGTQTEINTELNRLKGIAAGVKAQKRRELSDGNKAVLLFEIDSEKGAALKALLSN